MPVRVKDCINIVRQNGVATIHEDWRLKKSYLLRYSQTDDMQTAGPGKKISKKVVGPGPRYYDNT